MRICTINGYPQEARLVLEAAGVTPNHLLFANSIRRYYPDVHVDNLMIADVDYDPAAFDLNSYDAFIWTGSILTIYDDHDDRVTRQIKLCRKLYARGIPQLGSCWSIQLAAVAAGGEAQRNPRGREWGIARDIELTEAGKVHPLYVGKPSRFNGFTMHLDHVTRLPEGATILAGNEHAPVQALEVKFKKGIFWATQYHSEYTPTDMLNFIRARGKAIVAEGLIATHERLDAICREFEDMTPNDLTDTWIREVEIRNFFEHLVFPRAYSR